MEFYGLIGEKLSHSLSPTIHREFFRLTGIEGAYKLFELPQQRVDAYADALRLLDIRGANVTIPYKQAVMRGLDALTDEARDIGAVNTIYNEGGRLTGYNTDYFGFRNMLFRNSIDPTGKSVVLLGTGGAAQAVLAVLRDLKAADISCVSRNPQTAQSSVQTIGYDALQAVSGYLLVNTTPVGMHPNLGASPAPKEAIARFDCIVDLIYNPAETELLRLGKELGKKTCGGLEMLVGQALKAQEIWQGRSFDETLFAELLRSIEQLL